MENPYNFNDPSGIQIPQIGNPIASAATITPTHLLHHVIGTETIKTITAPYPDFVGPVVLIADAGWTWDATGNIAVALSGNVVVGESYPFYFDRQLGLWYPKIATVTPPDPTSIVTGTVTYDDVGGPITWVGVQVGMTVDSVPWPAGPATTDGSGVYSFSGVPAGAVVVAVSADPGPGLRTGSNSDTTVPPTTLTLDIYAIGA